MKCPTYYSLFFPSQADCLHLKHWFQAQSTGLPTSALCFQKKIPLGVETLQSNETEFEVRRRW